MDIRVFHFCTFFEFLVAIFYFMHKYHKTFPKKIWAKMGTIWPPHRAPLAIPIGQKIKSSKHGHVTYQWKAFLMLINLSKRTKVQKSTQKELTPILRTIKYINSGIFVQIVIFLARITQKLTGNNRDIMKGNIIYCYKISRECLHIFL